MSTMTLTQSAAPTQVTVRRPATVRRGSNVRAAIMPVVSGLLLVLAVLVVVGVLSAAVAVILAGDSAVATRGLRVKKCVRNRGFSRIDL